jgi:hypothetical protein
MSDCGLWDSASLREARSCARRLVVSVVRRLRACVRVRACPGCRVAQSFPILSYPILSYPILFYSMLPRVPIYSAAHAGRGIVCLDARVVASKRAMAKPSPNSKP